MKTLFIGRFQPFHNGHLAVIQHYADKKSSFSIGIGSSQYGNTIDNPFTFEERKEMIQQIVCSYMENYSVEVVPIPDIHDPSRWVNHVKRIIPDFDIILSNNPLTKALFTEKGHIVKTTKLFDRNNYSGKEIRRRMIYNEPWEHLVPPTVAIYLNQIDAVKRMRRLQEQEG
ncbi:MAG: nicotinamide-nucleotide adenylyltransferase [Thermoplasmatota archaeon]